MTSLTMGLLVCSVTLSQSPDLGFKPAGEGQYAFDTGRYRGIMLANEAWEGIATCVDARTGRDITGNDPRLGIFHLYRLLATDKRYGENIWAMPKSVELGKRGELRLKWAPAPDRPFEIYAVYEWKTPDTLDLYVRVTAKAFASRLEVFIGSYFNPGCRGEMYLTPARYAKGTPEFVPIDVNPLINGTYCMFPRDLKGAQNIYDGRWLQGPNPVDWAVSRFMAAPISLQRNKEEGYDVLVMADPRTCFSMAMSYNMDPPDGVANHHSTYVSLFGHDVKEGQVERAFLRAVLGGPFSKQDALAQYNQFMAETPMSHDLPTASAPAK